MKFAHFLIVFSAVVVIASAQSCSSYSGYNSLANLGIPTNGSTSCDLYHSVDPVFFQYYWNLCGEGLTEDLRTSCSSSQVCQFNNGFYYNCGSNQSIAALDTSLWNKVLSQPPPSSEGVQFTFSDGAFCSASSAPRVTYVSVACDNSGIPYLANTNLAAKEILTIEGGGCSYYIFMTSSFACQSN